MRFVFLLILSSLVLFSFKQENKDVIHWQSNRPLTWDDFRGKPQKRFAAASTAYDILKTVSKQNGNSARVNIQAVFFCKTSWKKTEWASE